MASLKPEHSRNLIRNSKQSALGSNLTFIAEKAHEILLVIQENNSVIQQLDSFDENRDNL